MDIKTDKPAFPASVAIGPMGEERCSYHYQDAEGMTLRDYFAAKAMQGMLSDGTNFDDDTVASVAYGLADAMLIAREM